MVYVQDEGQIFLSAQISLINPGSFSTYIIKMAIPRGNTPVLQESRASDEKCIKELNL